MSVEEADTKDGIVGLLARHLTILNDVTHHDDILAQLLSAIIITLLATIPLRVIDDV